MKRAIFTAENVRDSILTIRNNGVKRGAYVGLPSLYKKYSMKLGSTTYIYAAPHQGKSQFTFELIINTAEFNGWRWALFTPETGSPADVFSELLWVYLRKPIMVNDKITATDEEVENGIEFINNHFYIIDGGLKDVTASSVLGYAEEIEQEFGKIQGLLVDPYTEITNDTSAGIRDDIAIGKDLSKFRKYASDRNWHIIVTVHTKYIQAKYKDGISFIPKPTMSDIAGGQMWSRRGFMILNIWRCPFGLTDENGEPYEANQVEITIQKAKPKITGSLGVVTLFYDKLSNRYYEKDEFGKAVFAHQDIDIDYESQEVFINKDGKREQPKKVELEVKQEELDF